MASIVRSPPILPKCTMRSFPSSGLLAGEIVNVRSRLDSGVRSTRVTNVHLGDVRVRFAEEFLCNHAEALIPVDAIFRRVAFVDEAGVEAVAGHHSAVEVRDLDFFLCEMECRCGAVVLYRDFFLLICGRGERSVEKRQIGRYAPEQCPQAENKGGNVFNFAILRDPEGFMQRAEEGVSRSQREHGQERLPLPLRIVRAAVYEIDDTAVAAEEHDCPL
ncbi:hypothetical protein MKX08_004009 [Trichoderma sp. CBMAI-0020]|nr:hypothetical protein MKX08_004009 [Trichoderma sp. CBMAI-0020]